MLSEEKQIPAKKQKATIQQGSGPTNPFARVDTVIVRVPDLEKSKRWYEEKLGFEASFISKNEIVVFKAGGETSFTIYALKPGEKKP